MIATVAGLAAALLLLPPQGAPPARGAQRPRTTAPTGAPEKAQSEVLELRRAVEALSAQIELLRKDLARRDVSDAATVDRIQLLILDERAARLEGEIADVQRRVQAAQAREADAKRRMENIDTELILYGGLNRDDSERAIRASLTRQVQEAQREQRALLQEQAGLEQDLAEARREAVALRARLRASAAPAGTYVERPPDATAQPEQNQQPAPDDEATDSGEPPDAPNDAPRA
jgi:hypothetical protein